MKLLWTINYDKCFIQAFIIKHKETFHNDINISSGYIWATFIFKVKLNFLSLHTEKDFSTFFFTNKLYGLIII